MVAEEPCGKVSPLGDAKPTRRLGTGLRSASVTTTLATAVEPVLAAMSAGVTAGVTAEGAPCSPSVCAAVRPAAEAVMVSGPGVVEAVTVAV